MKKRTYFTQPTKMYVTKHNLTRQKAGMTMDLRIYPESFKPKHVECIEIKIKEIINRVWRGKRTKVMIKSKYLPIDNLHRNNFLTIIE